MNSQTRGALKKSICHKKCGANRLFQVFSLTKVYVALANYFPPVGIFLVWKRGRLTKMKRTIATVIATTYFVFPIIIVMATTLPLYNNHEEFIEAFNKEVKT